MVNSKILEKVQLLSKDFEDLREDMHILFLKGMQKIHLLVLAHLFSTMVHMVTCDLA